MLLLDFAADRQVFSYVNEEDKNETSMCVDRMRDFFAELDAGF